jgi:phospholipase/carboxylesterase
MRRMQLADLDVCITGGTDREGGGSGPVIVLLHGFGAPGDDLVPLWRVLDVPREVRFVFPAAPIAPAEFAEYGGRAWWPIDMLALQQPMTAGDARDRSRELPARLPEARAQVIALLDAVERALDVRGEHVLLGGFSQGAMLACDLALHTDRKLAGLALLSATLLCRDVWQPRMTARSALPIFQAHGRADPLLPYALATELRDLLCGAGCNVEWVEFNGGHEIPSSVLQALGPFIRKHVFTTSAERSRP